MSCFLDKIDSSQAEKERAKAKPRAESRSCHEKRGRASWRWIPMAEIRAEGRKKQPLSQVTLSFLLLQYTHCLHLLVWCTWAHASIVHMAHMHTCLHCSYGTHACIAHMHTHTHTHTHTHIYFHDTKELHICLTQLSRLAFPNSHVIICPKFGLRAIYWRFLAMVP